MKKVRFLRDYQVKAADGELYEKDYVYELSDESAQHFINRQLAVDVAAEEEPKPKAAKGKLDKAAHKETVAEEKEIAKFQKEEDKAAAEAAEKSAVEAKRQAALGGKPK